MSKKLLPHQRKYPVRGLIKGLPPAEYRKKWRAENKLEHKRKMNAYRKERKWYNSYERRKEILTRYNKKNKQKVFARVYIAV